MRICQVGTGFLSASPTVTGGTEKYIYYLSATLQGMGHEVTLMDMAHVPRPDAPFSLVEVATRWRFDSNLLAHATRGLLFGRAVARQLDLRLREKAFDVVNFHSQFSALVGIPVARRHRVPAVFTGHNPLWSDAIACRSRLERANFWMERRAYCQADAVVCVGRAVADNLVRYFSLAPSRLWVVPVGIDRYWLQDRNASSRVREEYAPHGEPIVLHVGRIAPYKNQLTLARAFSLVLQAVPNARLVVAGPVESQAYCKTVKGALARARVEDRVVFAGHIPLDEMAQLYALAQVFVMPSLRENCPQAVLEAMAQGCAIVGSDIPPMQELLPEGVGLTVPATDHGALAQAIISVLKDGGLRRRLGTQARRRAYETYRWEVVARRIADQYERLLNGKQAVEAPPDAAPSGA